MGEEEAEQISAEYKEAQDASDREYADAEQLTSAKTSLTDEEQLEIKLLWKKLVRLYHPDLFANDPVKKTTYEKLIQAINDAREKDDIQVLREISNDPDGYIAKNHWGEINISDSDVHEGLLKLYRAIEIQIVERIEVLQLLRESSEYELMQQCRTGPSLLDYVAEQQRKSLEVEIKRLEIEAYELYAEIQELTGRDSDT